MPSIWRRRAPGCVCAGIDSDQRRVVLAADFLHAIEDLPLDGHIQRRGGFVADDQVRLVEHGDGDRHALAHAAGELVREAAQALVGRRNAHRLQRLAATFHGLGARDVLMRENGFGHLFADAQHRVQRHQRILEDHGDAVAAQLPHLLFAQLAQVLALEADLAFDHFAGRVDQPQQRKPGDRFARAGFADQPHDFAAAHDQVDAVDGGPGAGFGMECGAQAAHVQEDVFHARRGSRLSRRRSPTMLMERISSSSARPGNRLIQ
ncbi:Uncharacterised protein [Bordetella pertussis]|nr:Uncharacterised protein [Bordetella pertussis]